MIADQAINAVERLLKDAGHAADRVASDYGEDLLVQTAFAGRLDASRLWVQVKGTANARRLRITGGFSYGFPYDQVLRWTRSADSVLVVLWDVKEAKGWFSIPEIRLHQLDVFAQKTVQIHFDADDIFDASAVDRLVWRSRISHYDTLILRARSADAFASSAPPDSRGTSVELMIALDFLRLIGLAEIHPNNTISLHNAGKALLLQRLEESGDEYTRIESEGHDEQMFESPIAQVMYLAAIHTILTATHTASQNGLPIGLLHSCARVLLVIAGAGDFLPGPLSA